MTGADHRVDRTVLRHQAAAWELLHALFSSLPADEDYSPSPSSTISDGDDGMGDEPTDTQALAALQRRAELSRWLRERSRSAAEHAATTANTAFGFGNNTTTNSSNSRSDVTPQRVLALLSGHQLAPAAAAAAIDGDVRLATLLATAGSTTRSREQLTAQLAVWRDASFDSYIDPQRRQIYQLLGGHVDSVIPSMQLDWRRALGCYLWYGCHPDSDIIDAVKAYQVSVKNGLAPPPVPLYLELLNNKESQGGDGAFAQSGGGGGAYHDVMDINFELVRLYCTLNNSNTRDGGGNTGDDFMDDSNLGDFPGGGGVSSNLARLLRPAGVTPDPLDYSFPWHLLCVLRSINAIPRHEDDDSSPAAAIAHMAFISQLESLGELAHWAIYVALHLPDPMAREKTVKELLARHCPDWTDNEEINQFLTESLNIPTAWLAEANALWSQYKSDDITELANLIDAGDMAAAHAKLCDVVAPAWLLSSSFNAKAGEQLEDALAELQARATEIDAMLGAGTWNRGGGLYSDFLTLQKIYNALATRHGIFSTRSEISNEDIPPYEERMQYCDEVAQRLNDAAAVLAVAGTGGARDAGASIPLRRAALAKMSDRLSSWVMGDALGEDATPGPGHAVLVSGLRSLRHGKVAAAVQSGATRLAETLA